jgi:hypothetical protein
VTGFKPPTLTQVENAFGGLVRSATRVLGCNHHKFILFNFRQALIPLCLATSIKNCSLASQRPMILKIIGLPSPTAQWPFGGFLWHFHFFFCKHENMRGQKAQTTLFSLLALLNQLALAFLWHIAYRYAFNRSHLFTLTKFSLSE